MSFQSMQSGEKTKRRSMGDFFGGYFKRFPSILTANLFFAAPLAVSGAVVWGLSFLFPLNIFIQLLPIPLCAPFFAGVVQVTRDMIAGKKEKAVPTFFKGLKNNWRQFLLHGVIFYLAILLDYFSIVFYYAAAATNPLFYVLFGLCLFILLFLLFMFFYVPVITVTLELPMRYVYKDAALMAVWELPSNFLSVLCLLALTAVVSTLFMLSGNYTANWIIAAVLLVAVLPATVCYIVHFFVYPKVDKMLIQKDKPRENDETRQKMQETIKESLQKDPAFKEALQEKANQDDAYVFHNGRMIKRAKLEEYYRNEHDV
ncbi:MAG TPA: YesL family protein [Candidatus Scatavimonas merdigallinarum]|uniref:YesL family protein n=1 Tax=Candidatus Scatavimonas merdigallinarum TaxID=2840914 RepID=A0A9D0ZL73_9FIRM|nr:YesL family protein [Candidatus Scatavimonas merdigallinarum]